MSTSLRLFAVAAMDDWERIGLERPHIPLLIKLQALAVAEGPIGPRLLSALYKSDELLLAKEPPPDFFEQWSRLLDAPWLLLFDGLEEVAAEERDKLIRKLGDLALHCAEHGHRIVLASRPFDSPQQILGEDFDVYELQPFLAQQKVDFARHYLGERAEIFLSELRAKELDELCNTPLLLTIAVSVFYQDGSLPDQRVGLFQRFIEIWLKEARARGLRQELGEMLDDLAQRGLEQLALASVERPGNVAAEFVSQKISHYLQTDLNLPEPQAETLGERFVRVMGRRSGIFIQQASHCEWTHHAFRDFLAASALERDLRKTSYECANVIGKRLTKENWLESLLMLAQMTSQPVDLMQWATEEARRLQDDRLVLFTWDFWQEGSAKQNEAAREMAVALLLEAYLTWYCHQQDTLKQLLVELGELITEKLLVALDDTSDLSVKVRIIELLGRIGDLRAIEPLIALLGDENHHVSDAAYSAFRRIGQLAIEPLLAIARDKTRTAEERSRSLYALGEIGVRTDDVSQALADSLEEGLIGEIELLNAVFSVARRLRNPLPQSAVQRALTSRDEMLVFRVANYLHELPMDAALPTLLEVFHRWPLTEQYQHNRVLRQIIYAMGKVETSEGRAEILKLLRDSLDGKAGLSPLWAAWTADELQLPDASALLLEELTRLLTQNPTDHLIWQILLRLEKHWLPEHLTALRGACEQLASSGANVPLLLTDGIIAGKGATDEHPLRDHSGQSAGVKFLAKLQAPEFTEQACRLLAHVDWSIENRLFEYLWVAGDAAAEPTLLKKLANPSSSPNPDWVFRSDIFRALSTCGSNAAVPAIVNYLRSEQKISLYVAQEALGPLLRRGVLPADLLAEIAFDTSATVPGRTASVEALGQVCPEKFTRVFQRLLGQTDDEWILSYAAHALGKTKDATVIDDLERMLASTNSDRVAVEAANALVKLDATQSIPLIRQTMERLGVASGNYGLLVALGWLGDESAIPWLKGALGEARRARNSYWLIRAIGRFLPADWAKEWLFDLLEGWKGRWFDDGAQDAAVETLARDVPEVLLEPILHLYDADRLSPSARETLTSWLPELSRNPVIDLTQLAEVAKRLLCDRELSVREQTGLALTRFEPTICQQICCELRASSDEWAQACAIASLGYWRKDDSELASARFSASAQLRHAADVAIKQQQRMKALQQTITQFISTDSRARLASYLAIQEQGDESTITALYDSLTESDLPYAYLRKLRYDVRERLKKDRRNRVQEEQKKFG